MNTQTKKHSAFHIINKKTQEKAALKAATNFSIMRGWQKHAFDLLHDTPYAILNAPMGSGKSWMICLLSAHKLKQDETLRCIIAVPQSIIASGFTQANILMPDGEKLTWQPQHNLCDSSSTTKITTYIIEFLSKPNASFNDRILLCTHSSLVRTFKVLREAGRLDLLNDLLVWIDEAHHSKNNTLTYAPDNVISNAIGELISTFLNKASDNIQIGLATASFFRGDRYTLLTNTMEEKFHRFNLPYDKYLESMDYLESFSFDFLVCGPDYTKAIGHLVKDRIGKDIIYIPHPISKHSTGNKHQEVKSIISEYQKVHGEESIATSNGLRVLLEKDKSFKILDLVDENKRSKKKSFSMPRLLKKIEIH